MIIKQKYISKYLLMMAVDQLFDEFQERGFEIKTQYPIIGSLRVDIFAVKGDKRIAVEFVDNQISDEWKALNSDYVVRNRYGPKRRQQSLEKIHAKILKNLI